MLFIVIVLSLPVYAFAIWSFFEPEEAFLFGDRWRYQEVPEPSDIQVKLIKWGAVAGMIVTTMTIIFVAVSSFS